MRNWSHWLYPLGQLCRVEDTLFVDINGEKITAYWQTGAATQPDFSRLRPIPIAISKLLTQHAFPHNEVGDLDSCQQLFQNIATQGKLVHPKMFYQTVLLTKPGLCPAEMAFIQNLGSQLNCWQTSLLERSKWDYQYLQQKKNLCRDKLIMHFFAEEVEVSFFSQGKCRAFQSFIPSELIYEAQRFWQKIQFDAKIHSEEVSCNCVYIFAQTHYPKNVLQPLTQALRLEAVTLSSVC